MVAIHLPDADLPSADGDPLSRLAGNSMMTAQFRQVISGAVTRHPMLAEAMAASEEARATRNEALARRLPTVDLSLSYFNIVSRAFSNDPLNLLERSRPSQRTDGILSVQQPLVDFGAAQQRVRAARARLDAAIAEIDDTEAQLALRAIAAWTGVATQRAAVDLVAATVADQRGLRRAIDDRIAQGYAAPADAAQLDGYVAAGEAQLADLRRALANAEAQYTEMVGAPPPAGLMRVPIPDLPRFVPATVRNAAETLPSVRAAGALANAALYDASSARAANLPQLGLGLTAGRYGVLETGRDYDVRGAATLSWRLFGGAGQRADQARARAHSAEARFARTREEARRDAAIALADVDALSAAEQALAADYRASRIARNAVLRRFRVSRGTLLDVAVALGNHVAVAARYLQTLGDLDVARYTLLAKTGVLLPALAIAPGSPS